MKARLFGLHADNWDVKNEKPDDPECFSEELRAVIGPEDFEGGDNFFIEVCTPDWIKKRHYRPRWGRFMLIVDSYNYDEVCEFISEYVRSFEGGEWNEIAIKLSRVMSWEFEDYVYFDKNNNS
ncbi:Imm8 family immunity protein [Xanthomonas arboricola]|uniref:Imm8 family immunity protein n=1 Tax=Xanthomonas arboricola TaxID=56448 RepID=UPI000C844F05|nr:Imm8 family immunity protein [Xanthomonas arboricola]